MTPAGVVLVANEPVWPVRSGGAARMAGLATALGATVLTPGSRQIRRESGVKSVLSRWPRLLWTSWGDWRPDLPGDAVVIVSHSYLAPPLLGHPGLVVDFQNIEVDRQRSLADEGPAARRAVARIEAAKARRWEPAVARAADLCLAVDLAGAARLAAWGARVLVVPNAVDAVEATPSPERGPAVVVANASYQPNAEGIRWLVGDIWPLVRAACPEAELVVAGRGTDAVAANDPAHGVTVLGEVDEVAPVLRDSAVVLAPIRSGGGTQLKVLEALALGRAVVATGFSAASIPHEAKAAALVADSAEDFAAATATLLRDLGQRRARERHNAVPTWDDAVRPLAEWLSRRPGR